MYDGNRELLFVPDEFQGAPRQEALREEVTKAGKS
jgi:hypothetical protein